MPRDTDPWYRVKDKITGHEYSTRFVDKARHTEVAGPAADGRGNPLPAVYAEKVTETSPTDTYDDSTVAVLKTEIERRNQTREDETKFSASGTKTDLVAALRADDDRTPVEA